MTSMLVNQIPLELPILPTEIFLQNIRGKFRVGLGLGLGFVLGIGLVF